MRTFFVLLSREVKSFFNTPIAYVVLVFFLSVLGFSFFGGIQAINKKPMFEASIMDVYFGGMFWFAFILSLSLISMRSFSDEFRMGTIETLTTAPVQDWQVVLAKYCGVLVFYCALYLPTMLFFPILQQVGARASDIPPVQLESVGAYGATYLMLLLIGMLYVSLGCLASSLVKDQINAAVISFTTITAAIFVGYYLVNPDLVNSADVRRFGEFISPLQHLSDASRGRVDVRTLIMYPTVSFVFLFLTFQVFQYRKWKA